MTDFRELEIAVEKTEALFRLGDTPYRDDHELTPGVIDELNILRAEGGSPSEYGARLFRALFRGRLLEGYRTALQEVLDGRTHWRLRLNVAESARELHCLWWESLYDNISPIPRTLGRSMATPLSRYLGQETKHSVPAERIKVLAVISNPVDLGEGDWAAYPKLDEAAEREVIEKALGGLGDRVELDFQTEPASFARIRDRLKEGFHVLHIVGHAAFLPQTDKACLLLEKSDQTTRPIGDEKVGELVEGLPALQLVVLAACHSAKRSTSDAFIGLAPQVIRYGIPAAVAMQDQITEMTARVFTEKFYRALGSPDSSGGMVDAALNWARDELYAEFEEEDGWDWAIPVLFMRGDGRLFDLAAASNGDRPRETPTTQPVPPRPDPDRQSPVKVDQQARSTSSALRLELYNAMIELDLGQLGTICFVLWEIQSDQVPADQGQCIREMMGRCADEEDLKLLWRSVESQLNLRRKQAWDRAADSDKVVDLGAFRTLGRAS